jgi:hypothetical protein
MGWHAHLQRRCAVLCLQVAPPIVLPMPGKQGRYRVGKVGQKGIAVFLNSRGEMTAYDPQGEMLWQVRQPELPGLLLCVGVGAGA